jgi:coproporphyrinogen III oxidase
MRPFRCYILPAFKKECDNYFVNFHRNNERRGIGGIFYDYQRPGETQDLQFWMDFGRAAAMHLSMPTFPLLKGGKAQHFQMPISTGRRSAAGVTPSLILCTTGAPCLA